MGIDEFTQTAVEIAMAHSASITSWYRTPMRNKHVGGHPRSRHMEALAVDLVPDDWSDKHDILAAARAAGLIAVDEGDHIHIQAP